MSPHPFGDTGIALRSRPARLRVAVATIAALMITGKTASAGGLPAASIESWLLPVPGQSMSMHATVLRPPGAGPFPLVIVNHGSTQNEEQRAKRSLPSYPLISEWFLRRGYVVLLPQRPGHGETGGPYLEDQGRCESADFSASGVATANLIQAAIDHLTMQPFVRKDGVIVVGQSAGGWGALALASRNPRAVAAIVSFAGGRGGHAQGKPNNNCSPERLVAAAAEFGRTARVPTLWLYAENDSFFAPSLSRRMYDQYRGAGGNAEYHMLPPVGADGHRMINAPDAAETWKPILAHFLSRH